MDLETMRNHIRQNINFLHHECIDSCQCDSESCYLVSVIANYRYPDLDGYLFDQLFTTRDLNLLPYDTGICSQCNPFNLEIRCQICNFVMLDPWYSDPNNKIDICRYCLSDDLLAKSVTNIATFNKMEFSQLAELLISKHSLLYKYLGPTIKELLEKNQRNYESISETNKELIKKYIPNLSGKELEDVILAGNLHRDKLVGNNLFEFLTSLTGTGPREFYQDLI